jgi:hypothetical protein
MKTCLAIRFNALTESLHHIFLNSDGRKSLGVTLPRLRSLTSLIAMTACGQELIKPRGYRVEDVLAVFHQLGN